MPALKATSWCDAKAAPRLIAYVLREEKIPDGLACGYRCSPDSALADFRRVRRRYHEPGGRAAGHYVLSFPPGEVTAWEALDFAREFVERCAMFRDLQILLTVHGNTEHTHVHMVVNAIHPDTGKKMHVTKRDLSQAKEVCNRIARTRGLYVPEKGKTYEGGVREEPTAWDRKTYEMLQEGERVAETNDREPEKRAEQPSYIRAIGDAVVEAMGKATSREEFIAAMDAAGISVSWTDQRKHVTFTDRERAAAGEKKCKVRLGTLNDHYNLMSVPEGTEDAAVWLKTELEDEFTANAERAATGERYARGTERANGAAESARTAVRESEAARGESENTRRTAATEIRGSRSDRGAARLALTESRSAVHEREAARAAESGRTDANDRVHSQGAQPASAARPEPSMAASPDGGTVAREPERSAPGANEHAAGGNNNQNHVETGSRESIREPSPIGRQERSKPGLAADQDAQILIYSDDSSYQAAAEHFAGRRDVIPVRSGEEKAELEGIRGELQESASAVGQEHWYEQIKRFLASGFERVRAATRRGLRKIGDGISELSERISEWSGKIAERFHAETEAVRTEIDESSPAIRGSAGNGAHEASREEAGRAEQRAFRSAVDAVTDRIADTLQDRIRSYRADAEEWEPAGGERAPENGELESAVGIVRNHVGPEIRRARDVQPAAGKRAESGEKGAVDKTPAWSPSREQIIHALHREYETICFLATRNPALAGKLSYRGNGAYDMKLQGVGRIRITSGDTLWRQTGMFGRIKNGGLNGAYTDLLMRELPEFEGMSRDEVLVASAQKYHPDVYARVLEKLTQEHERPATPARNRISARERADAAETVRWIPQIPSQNTATTPENEKTVATAGTQTQSPEEIRHAADVERGKERLHSPEGARRLLELIAEYPYHSQNLLAMLGAQSRDDARVITPRANKEGAARHAFDEPEKHSETPLSNRDFENLTSHIRRQASSRYGIRRRETAELAELVASAIQGNVCQPDAALMDAVAAEPRIIDDAREILNTARASLERNRNRELSRPLELPKEEQDKNEQPRRDQRGWDYDER